MDLFGGEFSLYDYYHGNHTSGIDWPIREKIGNDFASEGISGLDKLVLDVGTGPGYTGILIARTLKCRVHGLDVSHGMANLANANARAANVQDRYSAIEGSVLQIPAGDETYDGIAWFFGPGALKLEERVSAFNEIRRVLKPDGLLYIFDIRSPVRTGEKFSLSSYFMNIIIRSPLRGLVRAIPYREIRETDSEINHWLVWVVQKVTQRILNYWNWNRIDKLSETLNDVGFRDIQTCNYQGIPTSFIPGRDYKAPFSWGMGVYAIK